MNRKQRRADKKQGDSMSAPLDVPAVFANAVQYHQAGRLDEAERLYRQILAIEPRHADSLHLLGIIATQNGRQDLAVELIGKAIAINAEVAGYHSTLGNVLQTLGRLDEALASFRRAIDLEPDFPEPHNNLGNTLRKLRRLDEAFASFHRAIDLKPDSPEVHYNLANVLKDLGRRDEAVGHYRHAVDLKPNFPEAHSNLGNVLHAQWRLVEATACFRRAIELRPDYPEAHYNLGNALKDQGKLGEATAHYRRAIAIRPTYAQAHINLGNALQNQGRFAEAAAVFEAALRLGLDPCSSYYGLSGCRKFTQADGPVIANMQALLAVTAISETDRAQLHFALGKIFDDLAEYDVAIRHFDKANQAEHAKHRFDVTRLAAFVDRTIEMFPKDAPTAQVASDSELPILIVGMPRSGTTLVEQILASHPKVAAGGELNFWHERSEKAGDWRDPTAEQDLIRDYLSLLASVSPSTARMADKMPYNFLHLGLVHRLFPNARIIHCRRNPLDTALSIYFTRFVRMHAFTHSRRDIVLYYREYRRLIDHWRAVLPPDRFIEIDYEDLIADQDSTSRSLVARCGLEWDDACLDFHTTDRPIVTASAWQARQRIYRTSVERWRHYEPWLGELRELLP